MSNFIGKFILNIFNRFRKKPEPSQDFSDWVILDKAEWHIPDKVGYMQTTDSPPEIKPLNIYEYTNDIDPETIKEAEFLNEATTDIRDKTAEAIAEINTGVTRSFNTVDELFEDLNSPDKNEKPAQMPNEDQQKQKVFVSNLTKEIEESGLSETELEAYAPVPEPVKNKSKKLTLKEQAQNLYKLYEEKEDTVYLVQLWNLKTKKHVGLTTGLGLTYTQAWDVENHHHLKNRA